MADNKPAFCFIGFGEAGQAVAEGLREEGVARISAWDILFPQPNGEALKRAAEAIGVPSRTADRHWAFARAWLADALRGI